MRIITARGIDVPYDGWVVYATRDEMPPYRWFVKIGPPVDAETYELTACKTQKEAKEIISQIAELAIKGTKLIRMSENGEITVVA